MSKKITDLPVDFQKHLEISKLEKENKALNETVDKLLKEIDTLREQKTGITNVIKLYVTPEEEILENQISRLQQISRTRCLDMNEAKMLDLYIKNKRLIAEKSTMNAEFKTISEDTDTDELLRLVEGEKQNAKENESSNGSGEDPLA